METNGFSTKPLKVKLLAEEQKATKFYRQGGRKISDLRGVRSVPICPTTDVSLFPMQTHWRSNSLADGDIMDHRGLDVSLLILSTQHLKRMDLSPDFFGSKRLQGVQLFKATSLSCYFVVIRRKHIVSLPEFLHFKLCGKTMLVANERFGLLRANPLEVSCTNKVAEPEWQLELDRCSRCEATVGTLGGTLLRRASLWYRLSSICAWSEGQTSTLVIQGFATALIVCNLQGAWLQASNATKDATKLEYSHYVKYIEERFPMETPQMFGLQLGQVWQLTDFREKPSWRPLVCHIPTWQTSYPWSASSTSLFEPGTPTQRLAS